MLKSLFISFCLIMRLGADSITFSCYIHPSMYELVKELGTLPFSSHNIEIDNDRITQTYTLSFNNQSSSATDIYHASDIICYLNVHYVSRLIDRKTLNLLDNAWTEHIMKISKKISAEEAFEKQDYILAFNLVSQLSEKERLTILKKCAQIGHVPAMYELAKELHIKGLYESWSKREDEVSAWIVRGFIREIQDLACQDDASLSEGPLLFPMYNDLCAAFDCRDPNATNRFTRIVHESKNFIKKLSLDNISPKYYGYHGMNVLTKGNVITKPSSQWATIRAATLES